MNKSSNFLDHYQLGEREGIHVFYLEEGASLQHKRFVETSRAEYESFLNSINANKKVAYIAVLDWNSSSMNSLKGDITQIPEDYKMTLSAVYQLFSSVDSEQLKELKEMRNRLNEKSISGLKRLAKRLNVELQQSKKNNIIEEIMDQSDMKALKKQLGMDIPKRRLPGFSRINSVVVTSFIALTFYMNYCSSRDSRKDETVSRISTDPTFPLDSTKDGPTIVIVQPEEPLQSDGSGNVQTGEFLKREISKELPKSNVVVVPAGVQTIEVSSVSDSASASTIVLRTSTYTRSDSTLVTIDFPADSTTSSSLTPEEEALVFTQKFKFLPELQLDDVMDRIAYKGGSLEFKKGNYLIAIQYFQKIQSSDELRCRVLLPCYLMLFRQNTYYRDSLESTFEQARKIGLDDPIMKEIALEFGMK